MLKPIALIPDFSQELEIAEEEEEIIEGEWTDRDLMNLAGAVFDGLDKMENRPEEG
jgi:hypothetical protein